jgi:methyl-accepting chemotaxis protein
VGWRRRKSVVNMKQQLWFALELTVVSLGFVILCSFLLFMPPMSDFLTGGMDIEAVAETLLQVVLLKWPFVVLGIVILIIIGMLMSHRLSGPLFGLEKVMNQWASGNRKARVYFRKYDYLRPAMNSINSLLEEQDILLSKIEEFIQTASQSHPDPSMQRKAEEILGLLQSKERSEEE